MSARQSIADLAAAKLDAKRTKTPAVEPSADADADHHRNAPKPDDACLYGLIGRIAEAGSRTTEAHPHAVALNALVYLGCAVGRRPYMPVGNTYHHARLFGLLVGRSGVGRKGDAASLLHRIDMRVRAKREDCAPQVHRGGLSTREGLICLIHDGYTEGKTEVEPIDDKRLCVFESEFANVLHQTKRDGNTLSAALRDCWDGVTIKPATKHSRISATDPHVGLMGSITPSELLSTQQSRELTNGFQNRFLPIYAERRRLVPFPEPTPKEEVERLADEIINVLDYVGKGRLHEKDQLRMQLSPAAKDRYVELYRGELNRLGFGPLVNGLLERRAPMLLRIAMILALTDQTQDIRPEHIDAALAWIKYSVDSVCYIFNTGAEEQTHREAADAAGKIVVFLGQRASATRTEISAGCFNGKLSRDRLDAAIVELISTTPPRVIVEILPRANGPGSPTRVYTLAKSAESANCEQGRGVSDAPPAGEISEVSGIRTGPATSFRSVRSIRRHEDDAQPVVVEQNSVISLISPRPAPGSLEELDSFLGITDTEGEP